MNPVSPVPRAETAFGPDARTPEAERRRALFATNDAMAGLGWAASATWVVAPEWRVAADATALAARTGVDGVVLTPLGAAGGAQPAVWRRGR